MQVRRHGAGATTPARRRRVAAAGVLACTLTYALFLAAGSHRLGRAHASIVASCRGRHDVLARAMRAWVDVEGVDEVVLVDWSSDPPLRDSVVAGLTEKAAGGVAVRLVEVHGEDAWVLSRAYNLGFAYARNPWILKLDCDYLPRTDILRVHGILNENEPSFFFSGNWRTAKTPNEEHLNGALLVPRSSLVDRVNGYDERIQTYGWDDTDLYHRLELLAGLTRRDFESGTLWHMEHNDSARIVANNHPSEAGLASAGGAFPPHINVQLNRKLLEAVVKSSGGGLWGPTNAKSTYHVIASTQDDATGADYVQLTKASVPPSLAELLTPAQVKDVRMDTLVWYLIAVRHLPGDLARFIVVHVPEEELIRVVYPAPDGASFVMCPPSGAGEIRVTLLVADEAGPGPVSTPVSTPVSVLVLPLPPPGVLRKLKRRAGC